MIRWWASLTALFCISATASETEKSINFQEAKSRCHIEVANEAKLYLDDFPWDQSREQMASIYNDIYSSGKRLARRAYFDSTSNQFFMNYELLGETYPIAISEQFIAAITQQIEEALARDYVEYVFFPDMGHAHVFIDQDHYDNVISKLPKNVGLILGDAFGHEKTKILYHTAEQLLMKDRETKEILKDEFIRWRYYTRNLVGSVTTPVKLEIHKQLKSGFNTVRDYPGYKYWGAGFDLSASKNGCFPFKTKSGEIQYFDLSFYALADKPRKKTGSQPTGLTKRNN